MKDKVFLDTNILVYSYSNDEPSKRQVAQNLISENNSVISTQVIQELINTITRKFNFSYDNAIVSLQECLNNNNLHTNSSAKIIKACAVAKAHKFSFL